MQLHTPQTVISGHRYRLTYNIKTEGMEDAKTVDPAFSGFRVWAGDGTSGNNPCLNWFNVTTDHDGGFSVNFVGVPGGSVNVTVGARIPGSAATPGCKLTIWNIDLTDLTELGVADMSVWPYQVDCDA